MSNTLRIDIVSDVVCPWCMIGWERLKKAAELLDGEVELAIHWRPFELNPEMAPEGVERTTYLAAKFGPERMNGMHDRLSGIAAEDGIEMHFDRITRQPRTLDAHRLIDWAQEQDRGTAMSERLFRAYFAQGLDIGDHDTLVTLAGEVGFPPEAAGAFLESGEGAERVRTMESEAHRLGINGVPFMILDRRMGVSGAQPPEVLVQAIREAASTATVAG